MIAANSKAIKHCCRGTGARKRPCLRQPIGVRRFRTIALPNKARNPSNALGAASKIVPHHNQSDKLANTFLSAALIAPKITYCSN
jgi:hypothetical protein